MLEMNFTTEVLVIGITDPALNQPLIGEPFHMLEHEQSGSQSGWCRMGAAGATEACLPMGLKGGPVNALSQLHQWVL